MFKTLIKNRLRPAFAGLFFVLALASLLSLSACNEQARVYAVDTAVLASGLIELDKQFETTADSTLRLPVFNEAEIARLKQIKDDLNRLRQTVRDLIQRQGGVAQMLVNAQQVGQLYRQGAMSYLAARNLVASKWNRLSPEQQQKLLAFDRQAIALDQAITRIRDAPQAHDITPIVRDVLTVGAATAKILLAAGVI